MESAGWWAITLPSSPTSRNKWRQRDIKISVASIRRRATLDRSRNRPSATSRIIHAIALVAGALVMVELMAGITLAQNWDVAGIQLICCTIYFVLLTHRGRNFYSLDTLLFRRFPDTKDWFRKLDALNSEPLSKKDANSLGRSAAASSFRDLPSRHQRLHCHYQTEIPRQFDSALIAR